jgi:hypothetical protein
MIKFLHQGQELAQFSGGKAFAGKPVQVVSGQVCKQAALVFAERHAARDQELEVVGFHCRSMPEAQVLLRPISRAARRTSASSTAVSVP